MRVPTREEFSPLPQVLALLPGRDPLEVLPELENQLESVADATAQLREIAEGFREAADDIEVGVEQVHWLGDAGAQFGTANTGIVECLRETAECVDTVASAEDTGADGIKDTIQKIVYLIGVIAFAVVAIIGIVTATTVLGMAAAILTLIGTLAFGIAIFIDEIWAFGQWWWSELKPMLEGIGELVQEWWDYLRDPFRSRRPPPFRDDRPPGPVGPQLPWA